MKSDIDVWVTAGIGWALRLSRLEVPSAVVLGEPAWLNCSYDLESDELYSVKWYKNNVEFYRFLPSDRPPGQKYDLKGVFVDLSKSDHGYVHLSRTTLQTEGTYRCEVSAEAPSFQTVREEGTLAVYANMKIIVVLIISSPTALFRFKTLLWFSIKNDV
ncbi:hypothetical protein LAZ67_2001614 [Cordylochernes scorpioides]|uniref:Ig-like domain-containing protein n=1 Tax=Cordylochernes scorpioides TaxID=51811 RepID=A0ABY6K1D3_9ARAC|nr:hypothetical protein LAZ67_2001614 [Cordylochernes scorpioides]